MEPESACLNIPYTLYQQFTRLKTTGGFQSEADLLQASLTVLEQQWGQYRLDESRRRTPYMSRPALSIEDYDT